MVLVLDVLIVGAGPHALTLASLLQTPCNAAVTSSSSSSTSSSILNGILLSKSKSRRPRRAATKQPDSDFSETNGIRSHTSEDNIQIPALPTTLNVKVVDTYGQWVRLWDQQFTALNIPHLRSHTLVHTDPFDKAALQKFISLHERTDELHFLSDRVYIQDENAFFNDNRLGKKDKKKLSSSSSLKHNLYFSVPGAVLIMDFFEDQVRKYHLENSVIPGTVEKIIPILTPCTEPHSSEPKQTQFFQVVLESGETIEARQVVLATGPTRAQMANIPTWVYTISESYPEERLQHTVQLMHHQAVSREKNAAPDVCQNGEAVLVIGGGLTSAHVVHIALQQGSRHVTWVMRKHLQLKQFDVGDVETLVGRYSHVEHGIKLDGLAYLRQFYNERSLHKRLAMIHQARKGGAITPEIYQQLKPYMGQGLLTVETYCQVSEAGWSYKNQLWKVALSNGKLWSGDRIWLATGCKLDVSQDPLLSDTMREFPIQVLDGWPAVRESLQWASGGSPCNKFSWRSGSKHKDYKGYTSEA
ncbi:uncharacterized protein zgc:113276 isoform X2 [Callorhinchus milii]|uniref:uncharacterized protein zgc:113276 isoform X2 n=1 Tax=Callorhinchus milii TaxID=7868 RepID=UPI001C3FB7D3|nr:uncharacterized protein zgc:113276 isoform X2 [Callorhinchus milii]